MAKTPEQIAARAAQLAQEAQRREAAHQREVDARNARLAEAEAGEARQRAIAAARSELSQAAARSDQGAAAAAAQRIAELGG